MSEREEIMDLIRNEYDPKPKLDAADFPGFEWDDGAGRIADAILADKALLLRKHYDERDVLVKALEEIALGRGTFAQDRFEHACNTIEDMKELARAALAQVKL
jgi:hypothetical protein